MNESVWGSGGMATPIKTSALNYLYSFNPGDIELAWTLWNRKKTVLLLGIEPQNLTSPHLLHYVRFGAFVMDKWTKIFPEDH
jgi:hypothetical protein